MSPPMIQIFIYFLFCSLIVCWGWNGFGESSVPNVAASMGHSCALLAGDWLTCWGHSQWGRRAHCRPRCQVRRRSAWVHATPAHSCAPVASAVGDPTVRTSAIHLPNTSNKLSLLPPDTNTHLALARMSKSAKVNL